MTTNMLQVKVGDGITLCVGSDRYAGTVSYVSPSGKTIRWQRDNVVADGPIAYTESQSYTYTPNPEAGEGSARWSEARGRYMDHGTPMSAGRHQHRDPSF